MPTPAGHDDPPPAALPDRSYPTAADADQDASRALRHPPLSSPSQNQPQRLNHEAKHKTISSQARSRGRADISALRLEKLRECLERRLRNIVLDTLGVGLRRLGRNAERAEHIDHEAMAHPHAIGQGVALLGQKYSAIGPRRRQAGAL